MFSLDYFKQQKCSTKRSNGVLQNINIGNKNENGLRNLISRGNVKQKLKSNSSESLQSCTKLISPETSEDDSSSDSDDDDESLDMSVSLEHSKTDIGHDGFLRDHKHSSFSEMERNPTIRNFNSSGKGPFPFTGGKIIVNYGGYTRVVPDMYARLPRGYTHLTPYSPYTRAINNRSMHQVEEEKHRSNTC